MGSNGQSSGRGGSAGGGAGGYRDFLELATQERTRGFVEAFNGLHTDSFYGSNEGIRWRDNLYDAMASFVDDRTETGREQYINNLYDVSDGVSENRDNMDDDDYYALSSAVGEAIEMAHWDDAANRRAVRRALRTRNA